MVKRASNRERKGPHRGRLVLPSRYAAAMLSAAVLWSSAVAVSAEGDISTKFPVNDEDPVSSVPSQEVRNSDPLEFGHHLQDLIARAEGAFRKGDHQKSAKYYEAVAVAVPDRALPFSRLCVSYGKLGDVDKAASNCHRALGLGGVKVIDHIRFINFTLQKKEFAPTDVAEIEASLMHLRAHAEKHPQPLPGTVQDERATPDDESDSDSAELAAAASAKRPERTPEEIKENFVRHRMERLMDERRKLNDEQKPKPAKKLNPIHLPTEIEILTCKLAARVGDAERLSQCMNALRGLKVKEELLLPFAWSQALIMKDSATAESLLNQARQLKLGDAAIHAMMAEQKKAFATRTYVRWAVMSLLGLALAAAAVIAALRLKAGRDRKRVLPAEA